EQIILKNNFQQSADYNENEDKIFTKVENEAAFPGGESAWRRYLEKNLNTSTPVENGAPKGTYQVIVRFIVSKDGTVSHVTAETMHGYGMEEIAKRIIQNGPKWTPAFNGKNVNSYRRQPITFIVEEKK
ncbi:MAG TPA: energy transducer TonB, partial [Ignavibacteriaceae bacterium]